MSSKQYPPMTNYQGQTQIPQPYNVYNSNPPTTIPHIDRENSYGSVLALMQTYGMGARTQASQSSYPSMDTHSTPGHGHGHGHRQGHAKGHGHGHAQGHEMSRSLSSNSQSLTRSTSLTGVPTNVPISHGIQRSSKRYGFLQMSKAGLSGEFSDSDDDSDGGCCLNTRTSKLH